MHIFILINFVPQIHAIGSGLVLYTYLLSFIENLGESLHFTSGMSITRL